MYQNSLSLHDKTGQRKYLNQKERLRFLSVTKRQLTEVKLALSFPAAKIMFFLFYSGCRPLEAFDLETANINPEEQWMVLAETKTDMPRGIPMHNSLIPLMSYLKDQGNEHVFLNSHSVRYPSNRKFNKAGRLIGYSGGQIATPINSARVQTGLEITPYVARHTVSTHLIWPGGVSEMIKDEILGHASENEMSRHYTHLPRNSLIQAINQLPYPTGLREDLTNPCKIRAQHEKTYGSNQSKTQGDTGLGDVAEWLKALPC